MTEFLETLIGRMLGFGALYGLLFGLQTWRLDLLHQEALVFLGAMAAWAVIWIVSVLNTSKLPAVIAAFALTWITVQGLLPKTADAVRSQVQTFDNRASQAIENVDAATADVVAPQSKPAPVEPLVEAPPTPAPFEPVLEHAPENPPAPDDDGFVPVIEKEPKHK